MIKIRLTDGIHRVQYARFAISIYLLFLVFILLRCLYTYSLGTSRVKFEPYGKNVIPEHLQLRCIQKSLFGHLFNPYVIPIAERDIHPSLSFYVHIIMILYTAREHLKTIVVPTLKTMHYCMQDYSMYLYYVNNVLLFY